MRKLTWLGLLSVAIVVGGASCSHATTSPEDFCQSWVASTCTAISSCCQSGESFDLQACRIGLSQSCQGVALVDKVQDGERSFDSGAASACLGTVTGCADLTPAAPDRPYAQKTACGNAVTGFRPPGASCSASSDCARAGDFATCVNGSMAASGVCARTVRDPATCSFSFASGELHVCGDGTYCDRGSFKPNPADPPSIRGYEFTAPCKPYVAAGGDCHSTTGQPLPCAEGLYCKQSGPTTATCTAFKKAGDTCTGGDVCTTGLACTPMAGGPGSTCQAGNQGSNYCFSPTTCGDGKCQAPETKTTCPQDCGGGICGDGICQTGEGASCPQDCCGDGICQPGETAASCPSDC